MSTAPSMRAAADPFAGIKIPPVPEPPAGFSAISIRQMTTTFRDDVQRCYDAIIKIPSSSNDIRKQKYQVLKELRSSVQQFIGIYADEGFRDELVTLINTISAERQALDRMYDTVSRYFGRTPEGFHVVELKSGIGVQPEIKVDLAEVQRDLNQLTAGSDKVQVVQILLRRIRKEMTEAAGKLASDASQATEIAKLEKALSIVQHYSDFNLTLQEKLLAFEEIELHEEDPHQVAETKREIDRWGAGEVASLFQACPPVKDLARRLLYVLEDRYYHDPSQSLIDYVKLWPLDWTKLKDVEKSYTEKRCGERVGDLYKLSKEAGMENPLNRLIFDYLFNFYDPKGELRSRYVEKQSDKVSKRCQGLADIGRSMLRLRMNPEGFFALLPGPTPLMPGQCMSLVALMKTAKFSKDKGHLTKLILAEAATFFTQFDMVAFSKDITKFDQLEAPVRAFNQKFKVYFEKQLEAATGEEKTHLWNNLTLLAESLVGNGEFELSGILFSTLKRFDSDKTLQKDSKEFKSLERLFNYAGNFNNLREQIKKREHVGLLSIPWLTLINKDCVVAQSDLEKLRDERKKALIGILGPHAGAFDKIVQANKKGGNPFNDWALMFKSLQALQLPADIYATAKMALEEGLKVETQQQFKTEKLFLHAYASWMAMRIYYKNFRRDPDTQRFIDSIQAVKLEEDT